MVIVRLANALWTFMIAGLILGGCSSRDGSAAIPVSRAAFAYATGNVARLIAVSDVENNDVGVFDASTGRQVAVISIPAGPAGLANSNGDLYVAVPSESQVNIYSPVFKLSSTLKDPGQDPISLDAFDGGKYAAVVNYSTSGNGPGSITMYAGGKARATITSPAIGNGAFDAFDASGNVFVTFSPKGGKCPCIGEISDATKGGKILTPLTTRNSISPNGIQVTTSGKIAIFDESSDTVFTYDSPLHGSLGSPVSRTALTVPGQFLDSPEQFAFTSDMKDLWVANDSDLNYVYEFAFPAGGDDVSSITGGGLPFGVAIFPKQYP